MDLVLGKGDRALCLSSLGRMKLTNDHWLESEREVRICQTLRANYSSKKLLTVKRREKTVVKRSQVTKINVDIFTDYRGKLPKTRR